MARIPPMVTVVMPVYNGEPYLRESVESILNQTFTDFEFIIIDDGSTDGSRSILADHNDPRIILLHNQQNLGQGEARNRGLKIAKGEFIALQDVDDVSLPTRLACQVDYLQSHLDIGLLGTAYYRSNSKAELINVRWSPQTDTEIRWRSLFTTPMCHSSIMIRRQIITRGHLCYKAVPPVEDYEFLTRLLKHTRGANLLVPLYVYRHHDNNTCVRLSNKLENAVAKISAEQINNLLLDGSLSESEIHSLRRCHAPPITGLNKDDMRMSRVMFQLFDAFTRQPEVDPGVVVMIRRQWLKRFLASLSIKQLGNLWTSGLLLSLIRKDSLGFLTCLLSHLPRRTMRRGRQRLGL